MTERNTHEAALDYIGRGLRVFPVRGKIPAIAGGRGVLDATDDPATVADWFPFYAGIGIAIPERVYVLDVDTQSNGDELFKRWVTEHGTEWYATAPRQRTGNGGVHLWFRYSGPHKLRYKDVKELPGIELSAHGKYVVAYPSHHPDTGAQYVWEVGLPADPADLPELPGWLVELYLSDALIPAPRYQSSQFPDPLDAAVHNATSWAELLTSHGWKIIAGDGNEDGSKWRHPVAHGKWSATIKHGCLFVYSPNTPFPETTPGDARGSTLFGAFSLLEYQNNASAAANALRAKGLLPETLPHAGVNDLVARREFIPGDFGAVKASIMPGTPSDTTAHSTSAMKLTDFKDGQMARTRWLWDGRIPLGGLTLLAGREGEGKSTIAFDCVARVTRGNSNGEYRDRPKDVIIVATEDSIAHTIKPRLIAAGADLERVFRVEMSDPTASLSLPVHIPDLEAACADHDVALIVLDPLLSRLGGNLDSHKDADVRRALEPLGAFAERLQAAVLGLIHLNKSGSTDALQSIMASRAFTAFARSVLFAMVDPNEESRHLLGLAKSNLGRMDLPTLTYTFDVLTVGEDDGPIIATKVAWGPESAMSVRDALEAGGEDHGALTEACEWLRDWLDFEGGSGPASKALREGKSAAHAERTIRRARDKLGLVVERTKSAPPSVIWRWPS